MTRYSGLSGFGIRDRDLWIQRIPYSFRSATAGSTRTAWRMGFKLAAAAAAIRRRHAALNVAASAGLTPKNRLEIQRAVT